MSTPELLALADRIDAWTPGDSVLVFIARERRMIADALRQFAGHAQSAPASSLALREVLEQANKAISTLPVDALGYGEDSDGSWPIRDELMRKIHEALSSPSLEAETIERCLKTVENLRVSTATDFKTPNCQGQRGIDRCDAFYEAYRAIRALARNDRDSGVLQS